MIHLMWKFWFVFLPMITPHVSVELKPFKNKIGKFSKPKQTLEKSNRCDTDPILLNQKSREELPVENWSCESKWCGLALVKPKILWKISEASFSWISHCHANESISLPHCCLLPFRIACQVWLHCCLRWGALGNQSTSVPPGPLAGLCQRRPWRMTGRETGRTAVHQLCDDIHSALFGGFVHSYLYMLNVCNNSPKCYSGPDSEQDALHCSCYLIQSSLRCMYHVVSGYGMEAQEVRLVAQGHMVSRAGIWTELFMTPKSMLAASTPFSLSWSTHPQGAIAYSKAWVRSLCV